MGKTLKLICSLGSASDMGNEVRRHPNMGADLTIRKQYGVPFGFLASAVESHIQLQHC